MKNAHNEYQVNQVETSDPRRLVIMLYEGAIKFLDRAAQDINDFKKYDKVNEQILRAQDIITELMVSLDMEQGGEIAENLMNLYAYMKKELIDANVKKERESIVRVVKMLSELKESWEKMEVDSSVKAAPEAERKGFVARG